MFCVQVPLFAQFTIQGKVSDQHSGYLEFVNVNLLNKDTFVMQSTTDSLGAFKMEHIIAGIYVIELDYWGNIKRFPLAIEADKADLHFVLDSIAQDLSGVTVASRKQIYERKVDRMVFNVENSVSASSGDLLSALKATPSVLVKDDDIQIIGKSSVRVMIDDRIVQLSGDGLISYLRSMSAEDVKSIEVITTPPSKYDAEGNSGLINIVTKKGKANAWSNSVRASYTQGIYANGNIGNTFVYNKNKVSLTATVDGMFGGQAHDLVIGVHYPDQLWRGKDKSRSSVNSFNGKVNFNYDLDTVSSLGFILQYQRAQPNQWIKSHYDIERNNSLYNQIYTFSDVKEISSNTSVNMNYKRILNAKGLKFSFDADYFTNQEDKSNVFETRQTDLSYALVDRLAANNNGNLKVENSSMRADFDHPLEWAKVTYGAKVSFTKTNSDVAFFNTTSGIPIIDYGQTDKFTYKENTQALYADIAKNFGNKWQTKVGLRYEMTQTEGLSESVGQKNKTSYAKLFPTIFAGYLIDAKNHLNFSYGRRINRPSFFELNPFRWYLNANSYAEGNPFLQPSFSDDLNLTYSYSQKSFSTVFLQLTADGYGQLPLVDVANNKQIIERANFFSSQIFGFNQTYVFQPTDWWQSVFDAGVFCILADIKPQYEGLIKVQEGWSGKAGVRNNITFNKAQTIVGEVAYEYNAPVKAYAYEQKSRQKLDLGVRFTLLEKKLQLAININDVLKTNNPDVFIYSNNVKQVINNYNDNRNVRISLRYNFGNNNIKAKERSGGNDDEKSRVK